MSTASGDDYLVVGESPAVVSIPETRTWQWPFLLVVGVGLLALGLIATGRLQQGVLVMAVAVGLAGLLRLVLPARTAGWLVSRSRTLDAALSFALAAALAATVYLLT